MKYDENISAYFTVCLQDCVCAQQRAGVVKRASPPVGTNELNKNQDGRIKKIKKN